MKAALVVWIRKVVRVRIGCTWVERESTVGGDGGSGGNMAGCPKRSSGRPSRLHSAGQVAWETERKLQNLR